VLGILYPKSLHPCSQCLIDSQSDCSIGGLGGFVNGCETITCSQMFTTQRASEMFTTQRASEVTGLSEAGRMNMFLAGRISFVILALVVLAGYGVCYRIMSAVILWTLYLRYCGLKTMF